jgi:uncharacterized membrane protein
MLNFSSLAVPETTNYMIAGYIVIFSVMFFYALGLYLRRRKLEAHLELLEQAGNMPLTPAPDEDKSVQ